MTKSKEERTVIVSYHPSWGRKNTNTRKNGERERYRKKNRVEGVTWRSQGTESWAIVVVIVVSPEEIVVIRIDVVIFFDIHHVQCNNIYTDGEETFLSETLPV